ncbi:MAG TPA: 3'(2'),5'-bisphosphate nucleotidase [Thermoanaerobaculia bacterium]|nr:3'(2'),5'-bisphosphate nucleotidase [Thermoanaerobaculia bacterium]
MGYENERRLAAMAVRRACRLCEAVQAELGSGDIEIKGDHSPVTVADYGAQAVIALTLRSSGSRVPVVGEESASTLRDPSAGALRSRVVTHVQAVFPDADETLILDAIDACHDPGGATGLRFALDPIDGTKGYLRREQYAVALALLEDGVPVVGALGCPALPAQHPSAAEPGVLFVGERGAGTTEEPLGGGPPRIIRVSDEADPRRAVLCESVESGHAAHDRHAAIAARLGVAVPPVRLDSQAKYGCLARGEANVYLRLPTSESYREKIWDHAAGVAVLRAAGGVATDVEGRELDFTRGRRLEANRGVIATNGRLHQAVLDAVAATAEVAAGALAERTRA